jgi:glutamate-1-semialdehyde 2,1-aminomutase
VVTDAGTGSCYRIGAREAFLFLHLDGQHTAADICAGFQQRFGELLSEMELDGFLNLARGQGFLQQTGANGEDGDEGARALASQIRAYEVRFEASGQLDARAQNVIAGDVTHDRRNFGPFPVYISRSDGVYKWDAAGQQLTDYWMGHGALLCGHSYPPVVEALTRQIARGTHYGASHELEVRWAEWICRLIPSAERVRFTASGTEATILAHRIARAFTGRNLIVRLQGHFHGWHDEALAHDHPPQQGGLNAAVVEGIAVVDAFSPAQVVALLEKQTVAAVILEPGGGSAGAFPWSRELLQILREATRAQRSLLIFDEVISGFRHSPGGVQQVAGVLPDLTTLAKILSGGLPGGAVAGRAEVMEVFGQGRRQREHFVRVMHTGTFNGNPLSAAAGIAMLEHLADGVAQRQARAAAELLVELVNPIAVANGVDVSLYTNDSSIYHILIGARSAGLPLGPSPAGSLLLHSHPERFVALRRALLLEGVDTHPTHGWVSAAHSEKVIHDTAAAFSRAFERLQGVPGFRLGRS